MAGKTPERIGFLGIGIMGGHMARRLAEADFAVTAWNRTAAKAQALAQIGVRLATTPEEAARHADVVLCMLSSGPVCDEVLIGAPALGGGVIDVMTAGATLVVMSSIPANVAQRQSARARENGGENGARDGTLAIMAGGEAGAIDALASVFAPLGRVTHVGPAGAGELAKLANQLIVASNICSVAEALLLAERGGADPAKVREALLGGFADSTVFRQHGKRMVESNYVPGGPAKYQLKDTGTALKLAVSLGLTLPVAAEVNRLFSGLVKHGGGDLDHCAAILELRRINGL